MEDKYYIELKEKALKVEIFDKARDYAKDKNKVNAYFEKNTNAISLSLDYKSSE